MSKNRSNLTAAITKLDLDLAAHDENLAEAAAMFAEGKLTQADLDTHIKARDEVIVRRKAMHDAVQALAAKDAQAEAAEVEAAKADSGEAAKALMPASVKDAAEFDKAVNTAVAALARIHERNNAIARGAYDAGMRGDQRPMLVSIRLAGDVIADRIVAAGLDNQLDTLGIQRPSIPAGKGFAEITEANFARLSAGIDHALRKE